MIPDTMPPPARNPTRHEKYYLKDGPIFLVENTLFRVPRYMLEKMSPVFAGMFALPPGPGGEVEGQTDAAPIQLHQVARGDFEHLMEILYPLAWASLWKPLDKANEARWTAILRLATQWDMAEVRRKAIDYLQVSISPITKIALGKQYNYARWVKTGFAALCSRLEPLTLEEGARLGVEDVIRCATARERIRTILYYNQHVMRPHSPLLISDNPGALYIDHPNIKRTIDEVFGFVDRVDA